MTESLTTRVLKGKATEHLIGAGLEAEYLNDSRIGRVVDRIYEYGIIILFIEIASLMAERSNRDLWIAHIDETSIAFHGKYLQLEEAEIEHNLVTKIYFFDLYTVALVYPLREHPTF